MPSTTVSPEMDSNPNEIKAYENGQAKLLPNELFHGEVSRANEFGEVGFCLEMIFV